MGRRGALMGIWGMIMALLGCATTTTTGPQRGGSFGGAPQESVPTGFINKSITVGGKEHKYAVYVPRGYDPQLAWPMIWFLHGSGERGDDGLQPTEVGIGRAIRLHPERFPAIVVFPQCPDKRFWDVMREPMEAMMAQVEGEYHIDQSRRYLTGISMGGYGAFLWGAMKTDTFAALMPICGGARLTDITKHAGLEVEGIEDDTEGLAKELAKTPAWIFHGADDETVPVDRSREMFELMKRAGGDVQYTEFEGVGHNSWDAAYETKKATDWLLQQRKK